MTDADEKKPSVDHGKRLMRKITLLLGPFYLLLLLVYAWNVSRARQDLPVCVPGAYEPGCFDPTHLPIQVLGIATFGICLLSVTVYRVIRTRKDH